MSICRDFTSSTPACKTVQLIEPDDTLLTATSSGSQDASLDESGSTIIPNGEPRVSVTFTTPKISSEYQFEYLYIDAINLPNPGDVAPVVVSKTQFGFVVDLAGLPLTEGYILRWRVVVFGIGTIALVDVPESLYLQIPSGVRSLIATFTNPRSTTTYGFTELRIENLTTPIDSQRIIVPQVVGKSQNDFTVGLSCPTDSDQYYLVARTPMIDALDHGLLTTDLDAAGFQILNVGVINPPPPNLVATDDPRLSDARAPLDGSVTNASVAADAAIDQGKLNLDGVMPSTWLGTTSSTAAQGDLAEYKSNKGIANGYAGLDNTGKVPSAQLPDDVGTGTVTSIGLVMPADFVVANSPVTTSDDIEVTWNAVADSSWFGNSSGAPAAPAFITDPLPVSLIPDLDASIITTGILDAARLPAAVGVGGSHAVGAVPDPGASGTPTDYLARDMTFKAVPTIGPSYQPTIPNPVCAPSSGAGSIPITVVISESLDGVTLLYKITPTTQPTYVELTTTSLTLPDGEVLSVYGAKAGYTNSSEVTVDNS